MDQEKNFAAVLRASIARYYDGSQGRFAKAAKVSESTVSRWLAGVVPTRQTIEKIAPHVFDSAGRPIPAARLNSIAGLSPDPGGKVTYIERAMIHHRFALEIDELLAEDGPLKPGMRADLAAVLDPLIRPYRRYLGQSPKRKTG